MDLVKCSGDVCVLMGRKCAGQMLRGRGLQGSAYPEGSGEEGETFIDCCLLGITNSSFATKNVVARAGFHSVRPP
jgi:hypothetical protein